jgi:hypothetical protein
VPRPRPRPWLAVRRVTIFDAQRILEHRQKLRELVYAGTRSGEIAPAAAVLVLEAFDGFCNHVDAAMSEGADAIRKALAVMNGQADQLASAKAGLPALLPGRPSSN